MLYRKYSGLTLAVLAYIHCFSGDTSGLPTGLVDALYNKMTSKLPVTHYNSHNPFRKEGTIKALRMALLHGTLSSLPTLENHLQTWTGLSLSYRLAPASTKASLGIYPEVGQRPLTDPTHLSTQHLCASRNGPNISQPTSIARHRVMA
jgi:hypothetical protein